MVGAARFELATTCTPCRYATRLRYAPTRESITEACTDSGTETQVPDQRKISMTFFSSCLSAETLTPRASAARADAPEGVAERADAALRLSSRRLRAPLMVKPCS